MAKKKAKKAEAEAEAQPQESEKQPLSSLAAHIPQPDTTKGAADEEFGFGEAPVEAPEQGGEGPEPPPAEQSKTIRVRNNLRNPQAVCLSVLHPGEEVEYREEDLWERDRNRISHGIATGALKQVK